MTDTAYHGETYPMRTTLLAAMVAVLIGLTCVGSTFAAVPLTDPLVQSSDLTYMGAFRVPAGALGGSAQGFSYTKTGFAFNPTNGSLFLNSHIYEQKTAEISIPQPVVSTN